MNEVNLAVEELLAIVIQSQGGRVKIPIDDFKGVDLTDKLIAIDAVNSGTSVVLTLVERNDVVLSDD